MLNQLGNWIEEKFGFSETTKLVLFVIFLLLFVALSVFLFITYLFEFFVVQAYFYGLMKSDSPVKAVWYTVFLLFAYMILKFIFAYFGIQIG